MSGGGSAADTEDVEESVHDQPSLARLKLPPMPKKRKGVLKRVSHALFGKKKHLEVPTPSRVAPRRQSATAPASVTGAPNYSSLFKEPSAWPSGEYDPMFSLSALPSNRESVRLESITDPGLLNQSNQPSQEDSLSDTSADESKTLFEPPIIYLNQPLVVRPAKPEKSGSGWLKKSSHSFKEQIKKREKQIAYLRKARADVEEANTYGLDSMAVPMVTSSHLRAEERRKIQALLQETREGFEELLNQFCRAIYARHGQFCVWRAQALRTRYGLTDNLEGVVTEVRQQYMSTLKAGIGVFDRLAAGDSSKSLRPGEWQTLCAQDAAMLVRIMAAKSQCLQLVRQYFSDEADTLGLFAPSDQPIVESSEIDWLIERGLSAEGLARYAESSEKLNLIERVDFIMRDIVLQAKGRVTEEFKLVRADIDRLATSLISIIDEYMQALQKKLLGSTAPIAIARWLPKKPEALGRGVSPTSEAEWNLEAVIRSVLRQSAKRNFGAGLLVSLPGLGVSATELQRWIGDALYWQSVDIMTSQKIHQSRVELEVLIKERSAYLQESLALRLGALYVVAAQQLEKEAINKVADSLEAATLTGSGGLESDVISERQAMALEDSLANFQLAWRLRYKETVAKSKLFRLPLRTQADISLLRGLINELADASDRDASVVENMQLQSALDALSAEVKTMESQLNTMHARHNTLDVSLVKSISQLQKKKTELQDQLAAEEARSRRLEEEQVEYEIAAEEVEHLKELLAATKTEIKARKQASVSAARKAKAAADAARYAKELERQENELQSLSAPARPHHHKKLGHWLGGIVAATEGSLKTSKSERSPPAGPLTDAEEPKHKKGLGGILGRVVRSTLSNSESKPIQSLASYTDDRASRLPSLAPPSPPERRRTSSLSNMKPTEIIEALGLQGVEEAPADARPVSLIDTQVREKPFGALGELADKLSTESGVYDATPSDRTSQPITSADISRERSSLSQPRPPTIDLSTPDHSETDLLEEESDGRTLTPVRLSASQSWSNFAKTAPTVNVIPSSPTGPGGARRLSGHAAKIRPVSADASFSSSTSLGAASEAAGVKRHKRSNLWKKLLHRRRPKSGSRPA